MSAKKMRLLILTHGSPQALVIIERLLTLGGVEVAGIFVETETSRPHRLTEKIERSIRYDGFGGMLKKYAGKLLRPFRQTNGFHCAAASLEGLRTAAADRGAPLHILRNFHHPESLALMRQADSDLGVVLGTNILKASVYTIPRLGSINSHQGLAPYYRGGPPVFWELFNDESEVGVTVHFVTAQVDCGDIIVQESLPLSYDYSYGVNYEPFIAAFREKLATRAADLVPRAIQMLADGTARLRPQNIELGNRYRLPVKKEKDELRRRLRQRMRSVNPLMSEKVEVGKG